MLPTSTPEVERFTPEGSSVTYLIATPSVMERARFKRDLVASGATYHDDAALLSALREDLRAVQPANLDRLLEMLDQFEALESKSDDPQLVAAVADMERLGRAAAGRYAGLLGERAFFNDVLPIVAARSFLIGWEGIEKPFERASGITSDRTLSLIPEAHLQQIGARAFARMVLSGGLEKNSASPSPSRSNPKPSRAGTSRRTAARAGALPAPSTDATPV